ncbi:sorbose reductase Sou1p [[Candida] jaroonii]|uniref:Sorbose reductase Sou1p n=1 Tax=[Candida] jaroonii TaxID=467808 RepID=A0ACA9YAE6_9ASCO|nr:sorbose reductase Sou1p [[Candida] jaroonii]
MSLNRTACPTLSNSVFEMFSMKGKVTIITGASGGIAAEIAKALAEAGSDLALWYHNSTYAEELAKELTSTYGIKAKTYKVDVKSWDQVNGGVTEVVKDFGKLDVMIANAGIPAKASCLDQTLEEWHDVIDTDFNGAYYCARASGFVFQKQGFGNLIFTASMSAHIVNLPQLQGCYNAAKAGVLHLSKSLAVEWKDFARVNSVSPGYIDTAISGDCPADMKNQWFSKIPMGRDADPRELKGVYLYLASDASTYTTGADFAVDGGYCAP